jgi:hypothetical protein
MYSKDLLFGAVPRYRVAWAALLLILSECGSLPGSKDVKYTIQFTAAGRSYAFTQLINRFRAVELSEGPNGPFYTEWQTRGGGLAAVDIGPGRVFLFESGATPEREGIYELNHIAEILDTSRVPTTLYVIREAAKNPAVEIRRVSIEPVTGNSQQLGPTADQTALAQTVKREQQHGFQRVIARIIPYQVWATSEQSRRYFSQFTRVAIAKAGEAPPRSGWPDSFVQFPFYRDRAYQHDSLGAITGLEEVPLVYNGNAFEFDKSLSDAAEVWYSTRETETNPHKSEPIALVNYKGTIVKVKSPQEIYDPETKSILLLTNKFCPSVEFPASQLAMHLVPK